MYHGTPTSTLLAFAPLTLSLLFSPSILWSHLLCRIPTTLHLLTHSPTHPLAHPTQLYPLTALRRLGRGHGHSHCQAPATHHRPHWTAARVPHASAAGQASRRSEEVKGEKKVEREKGRNGGGEGREGRSEVRDEKAMMKYSCMESE